METSGIIYPPNRPLERSMKPSQFPVLYNYLFFIEANTKGEIILGSSNVAGTYWEGTLLHYRDFENTKENVFNSYFISSTSTSDAKFIDDDCVLLAEDNGRLKLLKLFREDIQQPMECLDNYSKENRIIQLSTWNANKFVTCTEQNINLYDIVNGCIHFDRVYRGYHTDRITSIDSNKLNNNLFISTSTDRKACLWDIRMDVPATVIYNNEFSSLTSASWNPNTQEHVVIGSEAGDIYLINVKQPKDVLSVNHCFDSSIHRTSFNEFGNLAVCGHAPNVLVYNCENEQFQKCYENVEHKSIVKGLSWYKNILYSCGFNKTVVSHCC